MSRYDEIIAYIKPYLEEKFAKSCAELEGKMQVSETDFSLLCLYPFIEIFNVAHELRLKQEKESFAYLCISFLRSSFLTKNHQLRLDLYDESYILDENPITGYWDVPLLFDGFERDVDELTKRLRTEFVRLQSAEMDCVRLTYSDYYITIAHKLCIELIDPITKLLSVLHPEMSCKILFGEYWGQMTQLYPEGEQ